MYGKVTVPLGGTILAAFGAYLILLGVNEANMVKGLMSQRSLILFGQWSYSMYLFQQFLLPPSQIATGWWQKAPFNLIGILLVSALVYYLWESPWRRVGRLIADKP